MIMTCLDVDGCLKGCLLRIVALEAHAVLVVPDRVSGDRRMMTDHIRLANVLKLYPHNAVPDLLADELCRACLVFPFAEEQLAQEGVQGLLLAAKLLAATRILLLECANKPLHNKHGPLGRVFLRSGCDEDGGVLGPV
jgi:hypothetical protein